MNVVKGKGVFGAIAIGKVLFYKRMECKIVKETITDTEYEKKRFEAAKAAASKQLKALYEKTLKEVGKAEAQIFDIHQMLLEDQTYHTSVYKLIDSLHVNAEYAIAVTADNVAAMFSAMKDEYMQARATDIRDVSDRLVRNLFEDKSAGAFAETDKRNGAEKYIICADELSPSETVSLEKESVLAFVTKYGNSNSHTAILARSMNIPAIVGVGDALSEALDGKTVAVDGFSGEMYIEPDAETILRLQTRQEKELQKKQKLGRLLGKEAVTKDGTRIHICVNVATMNEIEEALSREDAPIHDADGIGLFRSEFLYMGHNGLSDEQTQFEAYRKVLQSMNGKRVVIRTLDIGADKQIKGLPDSEYRSLSEELGFNCEQNPALGVRGIRVSLMKPEMFKIQLRALLRASVYGKLAILFPMITSKKEICEIQELLKQTKQELAAQGIKFSDDIEIGVMIETPAAAVISDWLAPEVDFFSVGTNDLIQYTLAVDRQNPKVDRFCDVHHEAVLRLVEYTVQSAHRHGKRIAICGELGADTQLTRRWLEMGIDELSVAPAAALEVKAKVREIHLDKRMEAVVFDMDGVIFDSEKLVIDCWKEIAEKYSIPDIEDACIECLGINAALTKELMLKRYGQDFPYDNYKKEMSALFHSRAAGGRLAQKKGIKELLIWLKQNDFKTAVASSTRREVVVRQLTEGGLIGYFDEVICGDMVSRSKPAPDIFLKACECLGVQPQRAYAIEDSYNGIRSAHAAGMAPIMVPDMLQPDEEMKGLATRIFPSLTEVLAYLKQDKRI